MKIRLPTLITKISILITLFCLLITPAQSHTADWGDIAADAVGAFGAEGMIWIVHKSF